MKAFFLSLTIAPFIASAALAADDKVQPAPSLSLPKLASLIEPGEIPVAGDMIAITRPFANWALRCDYRLSANKRLCAVEQALSNGQSSLVWRIANSTEDRPVLIVSVDPQMVPAKGVQMTFSELQKTIPASDWLCGPRSCITGFPFEGFVSAAIAQAKDVHFTYVSKDASGAEIPVQLHGSMEGFTSAINAGATDPFGKSVVGQQASETAKSADVKPEKKAVAAPKKAEVESKPVPRPRAENRQPQSQRTSLY